jgi:hypothetical protein
MLTGTAQAATAPASAAVTPQISDAATSYANALASGDRKKAYDLLSAESRAGMTEAQWQKSFEQRRPAPRKPPASAVLRAMATAEPGPKIGDVVVHADEAFIEVDGTVDVLQALALVQESSGWRVDLQATDRLNGRHAASDFLDAIRAETAAAGSRQGQEVSLSLLRALLVSEAKNYRVIDAKVEGDRAQVALSAQVPVNLVLRATRVGPGWNVDLARPMVPLDINATNPLEQAVALADTTACQDQLQQLVRATQMYANASDDKLPDPDLWLDQIRPFLTSTATMHCLKDPVSGVSYAMNRNLAGKRLRQIANPGQTVMFLESTLHGVNPADKGESWPKPPRHPEGNVVAYADGSVRVAAFKPHFEVKEGPPTPPGAAAKPGLPGRMGPGGQPAPTPRPRVIRPPQRPAAPRNTQ